MRADKLERNKKYQTVSHDELKDKFIGKRGTANRDRFEAELEADIIGSLIKKARKKSGMTQEELGEKIGVQKAWISKLENNPSNMTLSTLLAVLSALDLKVVVQVNR